MRATALHTTEHQLESWRTWVERRLAELRGNHLIYVTPKPRRVA